MNNIQRITVELDGASPFGYIIAKQGETNSRIVEVELMENSVAYIIPDEVKVMIKYRKPDGKKVLNDCTYSGNIVTVTYTEQMLTAYGTGEGEIMIVKGTEIIKSATFYTKIVETVYKENGLISDDEFLALAGTLIEVNEAIEKLKNATASEEEIISEAKKAAEQCRDIINGLTPRIGENGNWYIGKEDTGVNASGGIILYDDVDSDNNTNMAPTARVAKMLNDKINDANTKNSQLFGETATGDMVINKNLTMKTGRGLQSTDVEGKLYTVLTTNDNNNLIIGIGAPENTHIYAGKRIQFTSNQASEDYKGDVIEIIRIQSSEPHRTLLRPAVDGSAYLGESAYRWNTAFFKNEITASDLKEKEVIENFDFKVKDFIMGLKPIAYRRTGSGDTGERIHMGLGAQTLAEHINNLKLGNMAMVQASILEEDGEVKPYKGEVIDDKKLSWGINYTELLPEIILMLQSLQMEINELKKNG